jgi:hypothetical protein
MSAEEELDSPRRSRTENDDVGHLSARAAPKTPFTPLGPRREMTAPPTCGAPTAPGSYCSAPPTCAASPGGMTSDASSADTPSSTEGVGVRLFLTPPADGQRSPTKRATMFGAGMRDSGSGRFSGFVSREGSRKSRGSGIWASTSLAEEDIAEEANVPRTESLLQPGETSAAMGRRRQSSASSYHRGLRLSAVTDDGGRRGSAEGEHSQRRSHWQAVTRLTRREVALGNVPGRTIGGEETLDARTALVLQLTAGLEQPGDKEHRAARSFRGKARHSIA